MKMRNHIRLTAASMAALALVAGVLACRTLLPAGSSGPTETPAPQQAPSALPTASELLPLSTPQSDLPAAGICEPATGTEVTVRINPDNPDPRCVRVRPDQYLTIANNRSEAIEIQFGPFNFSIPAGGSQRIERPFGAYLAWGVHSVQSSPCCGGEIWLDPGLSP